MSPLIILRKEAQGTHTSYAQQQISIRTPLPFSHHRFPVGACGPRDVTMHLPVGGSSSYSQVSGASVSLAFHGCWHPVCACVRACVFVLRMEAMTRDGHAGDVTRPSLSYFSIGLGLWRASLGSQPASRERVEGSRVMAEAGGCRLTMGSRPGVDHYSYVLCSVATIRPIRCLSPSSRPPDNGCLSLVKYGQ